MSPPFRTLLTCALSGALGAGVGMWNRPAPRIAEPKAQKKQSSKPSVPASVDLFYEPPPSFTSATASLEWIWRRMEKGDAAAAETLFLNSAGTTEEQRGQIALELVKNFRRFDPRVLARIVLSLPRSQTADIALNRLISEWSRYDSEEILLFLETLPEDRINNVLSLSTAAFALAQLPAESVAKFASCLDTTGRAYLAEGLVAVADQAGSWRNTDAILSSINDGIKPHRGAISVEWKLGMQLADIDPQAIESQIAAETDPTKRDAILGGYAWVTGMTDSPRGLELDAQIQNQGIREEHALSHVQNWLESDRGAALAWLQGAAATQVMDHEMRAELLKTYGLEAAP